MEFPGHYLPTRTPAERKAKDRAFKEWCAAEAVRIQRQREVFRANLGPARAELQGLMLERAWELLDAGEAEAADALLEFVPEDAARQLLDEYFAEDEA